MNNVLSDHYIDSVVALTEREKMDSLTEENKRLRAKLEKVAAWLDRLAAQSDSEAALNTGRFDGLAEANRADARNWRASAADIRSVL